MTEFVSNLVVASLFALVFGNVVAGEVPGPPGPSLIGIDHIPTVVGNLEAATATYQRLGFSVKPGRFHESGLRNSHVKFRDGSGLELIAPPIEPTDRLARTHSNFLRDGEGPAYLSFHSRDPNELISALTGSGIQFAREGGLVTLADPNLHFIFFIKDNRSPTDKPEHFAHPNTAIAMSEVWLALDAPGRESLRRLLLALGAVESSETVVAPNKGRAAVFAVQNGRVIVVSEEHELKRGRSIIGVEFHVLNPEAPGGFIGTAHTVVAPSVAYGLWLRFTHQP